MKFPILIFALTLTSSLFVHSANGLEPDSHFSDHMVLQRDMDVPVWGTAAPNSDVFVSFAGQKVNAKADAKGQWRAVLKPLQASSEGRVMTISGDGKDLEIKNALIGDVWVGSGQSNMAGRVESYAKNDPTLAELVTKAPFPSIRLMNGGPKPTWQEATPETVPKASAILFAFGERLHRDLNVPIGLIVGAVGGTPSGMWIPAEILAESELCQAEIKVFAKTWDREKAQARLDVAVAAWEKQAAEAEAAGKKPRGRKPLPLVAPGGASRGGKSGGLFDRYIRSSVGYGIRGVLWDQGESGTGVVGLGQHATMTELIRGWRELWGQGDFPFLFVQKPSGYGNAFSNENPITREANEFSELPKTVSEARGGEGRFLYTRLMLDNENAWMVPAIDLGSSVHPINKWGYGNRAAEIAQQRVYKKAGVVGYGPIYKSHAVSGDKVTVTFSDTGEGLVTKHSDELQGFALAGDNGIWHWAIAKIDGDDTVVMASEAVGEPTQVRFGYAQKRQWANLFNKAGLPALAFTTESAK